MRKQVTVTARGVIIAFVIGATGIAVAQAPPPMVSPDRLPDVPPTSGDPFPFFDNYSWRSFIALNWPALTGPDNRGQPDRTKAFGDTSGPRVWMTWKSRYEIFQPGGMLPSPWASYDGQNPCGKGFANDVVTLSSFSAFGDFNQANFNFRLANPLVAQNHTYVRYEVRVNQPEFDSIVGNGWYVASNLPTSTTAVPFNNGSTEIKAAWRILTDRDAGNRSRYFVVPNAQVFDVASGKCTLQDVALVGFHIVTKTPERPQWIWSTFEHVDNVPGKTTEPTPPPTVPFSFNDPSAPQMLNPARRPPSISPDNKPVANPSPMQVVRMQRIMPQTMTMNEAYWNRSEIKGTVWQNYMLVMTQWPTTIAPESPANDGNPFPIAGSALSNTTMETYFQADGASCMACHAKSNEQGRDFVMFVTMDAFRPGVHAPSELFSAKIAADGSLQAAAALSNDQMVKSLMEFFEATEQK